ncbi:MAG: hypothetical protein QMD96_07700 [Anaerosomatales bacterium]|nr:hypothetical protein [Anaerosomatales bacterium]
MESAPERLRRTAPRHGTNRRAAGADEAFRAAIGSMAQQDRELAERIHSVVSAAEPELVPRMWYGMPAWTKDGEVVCFFQPAGKFKTRYATFGFQDVAHLDDGRMWPVAFAIAELTEEEEARIAELVVRAVGGADTEP